MSSWRTPDRSRSAEAQPGRRVRRRPVRFGTLAGLLSSLLALACTGSPTGSTRESDATDAGAADDDGSSSTTSPCSDCCFCDDAGLGVGEDTGTPIPIPPPLQPPPFPSQPAGGSCVTSIDCAGGLVCGYDPTQGCEAPGSCVAQVSGPEGPPACGCDGLPVQYVTPTSTSEPVASPLPCDADAGTETQDAAQPDASESDAGEGDASDAG
jgi:hypothetical protein